MILEKAYHYRTLEDLDEANEANMLAKDYKQNMLALQLPKYRPKRKLKLKK